jgi:hypothetical protein
MRADLRWIFIIGIPGLPRVVDALSTIMWPSMRPHTSHPTSTAPQSITPSTQFQTPAGLKLSQTRERALLDWASRSFDQSQTPTSASINTGLQSELAELENWLQDDKQNPWGEKAADVIDSPTHADNLELSALSDEAGAFKSGFEDDFTVFVSTPPASDSGKGKVVESETNNNSSMLETPMSSFRFDDTSFETDTEPGSAFLVPNSGYTNLYRSLGSVSDLGELDHDTHEERVHAHVEDEGEDDEDMPTKDEILEVSQRIFGSGLSPEVPKVLDQPAANAQPRSPAAGPSPLEISETIIPEAASGNKTDPNEPPSGDYDTVPFDLSRVVSALDVMKSEIAGMTDEGERRRAAARVALGLVYGLEKESG